MMGGNFKGSIYPTSHNLILAKLEICILIQELEIHQLVLNSIFILIQNQLTLC